MGQTAHQHSHHELSGLDLVAEAARALVAAGEQWTTMREAVFTELARHDRPVSA
jgi:Fur family zinc uptake transcriptional regulator